MILLLLTLFIVGSVTSTVGAQSTGPVIIKADGSVEGTSNIQRNGNVFTFVGDVVGRLTIERDNVVVDGAGHTLKGPDIFIADLSVSGRTNVTIQNITMTSGFGMSVVNSSNVTVSGNQIENNYGSGIHLAKSTLCTIEGNTIANNGEQGLLVMSSQDNLIRDNNLTGNAVGIEFQDSSNNVLRNNRLSENLLGFNVIYHPWFSPDFSNDVDSSNIVDGKPIIYWLNKQGETVPSNAGAVVLVNCADVKIQNLDLRKNGANIFLAYTTNSTISGNTIRDGLFGIELINSTSNTIASNQIENHTVAIQLTGSSSNMIEQNTILGFNTTKNWEGIVLSSSSMGNNITKNTISLTNFAIYEETSSRGGQTIVSKNTINGNANGITCQGNDVVTENNLSGNTGTAIDLSGGSSRLEDNIVTNNYGGIIVAGSGSVLRNNDMQNNSLNFILNGFDANDVDTSNRVDGKPIYYWINQHDRVVPEDAGTVILIDCSNITAQNLYLERNEYGMSLSGTTNSKINNNVIIGNYNGISLLSSNENTISNNNITKNKLNGVSCYDVQNNVFSQNVVNENWLGMLITDSTNNTIVRNNFGHNGGFGVQLTGDQKNNLLYHNNFVDNEVGNGLQVSMPGGSILANNTANPDSWDDGKEGNYWSDYKTRYPNATQIDSSGIGNTPYFINENNIDRYPLLQPIDVSASLHLPSPSSSASASPTPMNTTVSASPVPELQPWIILLLTLVMGVSTILFRRRIRSKHKKTNRTSSFDPDN
jgi:parallel beta-helix repeat protein